MTVDTVQPTLGVQVVHPKQDGNEQSSRNPQRDGKSEPSEQEPRDRPDGVLNDLGQLTGKTINTTA